MTELRVYLLIESLARQFAAYMSTPTRARGYPPLEGEHSLIIEVAPALAIHRICALALKRLGQAVLDGICHKATDQLKPRTHFADIIENVADQHAIILNRTREASMLLPGKSLLLYELEPALFATVAANEAEKAAPGITLVDVQMIGATGRLFLSGSTEACTKARDRIDAVLGKNEGRAAGRSRGFIRSPSPQRGEGRVEGACGTATPLRGLMPALTLALSLPGRGNIALFRCR